MFVTVYCHTSPSGKQYVGWTASTVERRWSQHVDSARRGSSAPFHRAIRKYGAGSFTHEVLELCDSDSAAQRAERQWIARRGTYGDGGYNATTGGDGRPRVIVSAETRAKLSAAHSGVKRKPLTAEHRAKCSASWTPERKLALAERMRGNQNTAGRVLSPEHREQIGAAGRGRKRGPLSEAHRAALKGAWRNRAPHSPETIERMRAAQQKRRAEERAQKEAQVIP